MSIGTLDPNRVLCFPITPFDSADRPDLDVYEAHVTSCLAARPGAVFAACGTGEFHALATGEYRGVVERAVRVARGQVPVITGCGGPVGHARACARIAAEAGVDGLLVMPPYLVGAPQEGLVAYVAAVAAEAIDLDVVVYHRDNARFHPDTIERLLHDPRIAGVKDGVGDLATMQRFVLAASRAGRSDAMFFNGTLTAELSQAAYEGIGVHRYSSAVFAMAPDIANAFLTALRNGDTVRRQRLLDAFYEPLVRLRDLSAGFAVSLIKAGVGLTGLPVGSVRPPLVDPTPSQIAQLADLLERGRAVT